MWFSLAWEQSGTWSPSKIDLTFRKLTCTFFDLRGELLSYIFSGRLSELYGVVVRETFLPVGFWDKAECQTVPCLANLYSILRKPCQEPKENENKMRGITIEFNGFYMLEFYRPINKWGEMVVISEPCAKSVSGQISYNICYLSVS